MTIEEAGENCERIVNNAESMLEGRESIATLLTDHARLVEQGDKWRLALEALTPQGSEFHNDLERCVEYVRARLDERHEALKNVAKLRRENDRLVERNRILEDVRKHYADEANWQACCSPDGFNDRYDGLEHGPGYDYARKAGQRYSQFANNEYPDARQADEQLEDLNGK